MTRAIQLAVACVAVLVATAGQVQAGVGFGIFGASSTPASNIVTAQGHSATVLTDLSGGSLGSIDVLWVLNASNFAHISDLSSFSTEVSDFVNAGGVFLYHDRYVTDAASVLPGGGAFTILRDFTDDADIDVRDSSTLVTNGPGGIITDITLDGGFSSSHGFAVDGTLPASSSFILSRSNPNEIVDFRYGFGSGHVYYSSIPLDFYLDSLAADSNFRSIYAPNVVAYAAQLSEASPAVVPEPVSLAIFGIAACFAGLGGAHRRRSEKRLTAMA